MADSIRASAPPQFDHVICKGVSLAYSVLVSTEDPIVRRRAFARMARYISMRSPDQVAAMEQQRGLRSVGILGAALDEGAG